MKEKKETFSTEEIKRQGKELSKQKTNTHFAYYLLFGSIIFGAM